jgi:hypothetical protein
MQYNFCKAKMIKDPLMKKTRAYFILLAMLSLALLSGCVSLVEEITVFEDGSGTLRFALGMTAENFAAYQEGIPEGFELENLFAALARDENVTSIKFDQYTADGLTWDSVELAVSDFPAVFGQALRIGPLSIELVEGEAGYRFTQSIDVANSTLSIPGVNLMDFSSASYVVRLVTPQIVSTNGVQPTAGLSTWSIPLDEVLQGGSTAFLRANYVLEPYEGVFIPWEVFFPYVVIGFLALGVISVLVVIIVNTSERRDKEPTLKFK